jgi:hypothetical protein
LEDLHALFHYIKRQTRRRKLEGCFGLNMETNRYIQHFKDQAAGKIPKNQKFYIVDQRGGVKANDVIEGPKPLASGTRRRRVRPHQSKPKKSLTKGTKDRKSIFD